MQTTKIFKFFRNVLAAAGVGFISCIIALCGAAALILFSGASIRAQDTSTPASPSSATTASSQKADTEWDGVTCELISVKRDAGTSITVQFKYTNTGTNKVRLTTKESYGNANLAGLVYYIDPKNKKKYTVIVDSDHAVVGSNSSDVNIEPGASKLVWAKLPAPPADVNSITVFLPYAPPFEGVTIAAP
jgi:hypothetical protein